MLSKMFKKCISLLLCSMYVFTGILSVNSSYAAPEAAAGTRHGLHVTAEELAIWRDRAERGPYKSIGDTSEYSPGEWDRIAANKEIFMTQQNANLWEGPLHPIKGAGPVPPNGGEEHTNTYNDPPSFVQSTTAQVRDAAFYALIKEDKAVAEAVKKRILTQFNTTIYPKLDFGNREYWAYGSIMDGYPAFTIAEWLTKYLYAIDYIEILDPDIFTSSERQALLHNFERFADVVEYDSNYALDSLFVDRAKGDYTPKEGPDWSVAPYYGAPRNSGRIMRHYNNMRMGCLAYAGLVGIHQNIQRYKDSAAKAVKEYVMFAVFPEGYNGDFYRFEDDGDLADKGFVYASMTLGACINIADMFARAGDTSLYDFVTTADSPSAEGSAGAGKSLKVAAQSLCKYLDGTYERYATDEESKKGDQKYRIDDRFANGNQHLAEIRMLLGGNRYYNDEYIKSVYMRTASGTNPYTSFMEMDYIGGPFNIYPSVLFMFGQMEPGSVPVIIPSDRRIPATESNSGAWFGKDNFFNYFDLGENNTGIVTVEFDVTPLEDVIDGVLGYADASANVTSYRNMPIIIRMYTNGHFEAIDRENEYNLVDTIPYSKNKKHHVKMIVDVPAEKFDVYITPEGGKEAVLAKNFRYRHDAPAIKNLGKVILKSKGMDNTFKVENHTINVEFKAPPTDNPLVSSGVLSIFEDVDRWGGSGNSVIKLEGDKLFLSNTDGARAVISYPVSESIIGKAVEFTLTFDSIPTGNVIGLGMYHKNKDLVNWSGTPEQKYAYFMPITTDSGVEVNKRFAGAQTPFVGKGVIANPFTEAGKEYKVQFGAVPVDGGMNFFLMVDGVKVADVLDTGDPVPVENSHFSIYCYTPVRLGRLNAAVETAVPVVEISDSDEPQSESRGRFDLRIILFPLIVLALVALALKFRKRKGN